MIEQDYLDMLEALMRAHRQLSEVALDELFRASCFDRGEMLEPADVLLLARISGEAGEQWQSQGHLLDMHAKSLDRLEAAGFLHRSRQERLKIYALTRKGREAASVVSDAFARHLSIVSRLAAIDATKLASVKDALSHLDRTWRDIVLYRL